MVARLTATMCSRNSVGYGATGSKCVVSKKAACSKSGRAVIYTDAVLQVRRETNRGVGGDQIHQIGGGDEADPSRTKETLQTGNGTDNNYKIPLDRGRTLSALRVCNDLSYRHYKCLALLSQSGYRRMR